MTLNLLFLSIPRIIASILISSSSRKKRTVNLVLVLKLWKMPTMMTIGAILTVLLLLRLRICKIRLNSPLRPMRIMKIPFGMVSFMTCLTIGLVSCLLLAFSSFVLIPLAVSLFLQSLPVVLISAVVVLLSGISLVDILPVLMKVVRLGSLSVLSYVHSSDSHKES